MDEPRHLHDLIDEFDSTKYPTEIVCSFLTALSIHHADVAKVIDLKLYFIRQRGAVINNHKGYARI